MSGPEIVQFVHKKLKHMAWKYTERQKKPITFQSFCPLKIYRIKMNDFWINVSYSFFFCGRQKTKKSECAKMIW